MVIPEFIKNVFKWLPVDCQDKQWCKKWKTREQQKDEKQRKLDTDYYQACLWQNGDEAKRFFDLGATNDYICEDEGGITPFIILYSFEQKEMCYELIREYEKSTKILSAVQNHITEKIRRKLEPSCGTEKWMTISKDVESTKDLDQLAKDAALWITCWSGEWELAAKWIDQGATNHFVDTNGTTALHLAAQLGSLKIVETILGKFEEEIDRKNEDFMSPLCTAFNFEEFDIAELMINKKVKYPIAQLLLSNELTNIEQGLSVINKWTDLKGQFKTDFKFIKKAKLTDDERINENMITLMEILVTKYKIREAKKSTEDNAFDCKICFHSVSEDQCCETEFLNYYYLIV